VTVDRLAAYGCPAGEPYAGAAVPGDR
jgi:hypothetical protein